VRTNNATVEQDEILTACEKFGGMAQEAAEIASELDDKLSEALDKIESLEQELKSK
jgi:hypothetical protein